MAKSTYKKLNELKNRLSPPNRSATLSELAEYMNCNQRSIYRYLEVLKAEDCGLQIEKTSPKRYFLHPMAAKRPDAIIRGLKSVQKVLERTGISALHGKHLERAVRFLSGDPASDTELVSRAMNVDEDFIFDLGPFSEYDERRPDRDSNVDKILDAIKLRAKLNVTYKAARDSKEEKWEVCPLKLILRIDTLYLVGKVGEQIKLFAVRRIKNFHKTGAYFPPIEFDYKKLYLNCFGKFIGISNENNYPKIKLVMTVEDPWLKTQFHEAHFNPPVKFRQQNPMVVELSIFDTPDLRSWLLGVLPFVKINEPENLKKELRDLLEKSAKAL